MSLHRLSDISTIIRELQPVRSLYAYAPAQIAQSIQLFHDNLPARLAYAVKANPAPEILSAVIASGVCDYDVASLTEIAQLHAACPEGRLHFNHPVKAPEDIAAAWHKYGVRNFVVDAAKEVDKIAAAIGRAVTSEATLLVRFIDPRKTRGSEYNFDVKFGAPPDEALQILNYAHKLGFQVGLAFHPGSQCENPQSYCDLLRCARRIALAAYADHGIPIKRLNLGGGWPAPYVGSLNIPYANYFRIVREVLADVLQDWIPAPEIIAEPGRALVAEACSLIARVELRKTGNRLHINDGYYGGLIEQYFVSFHPPVEAYGRDGDLLTGDKESFAIFGPTCDGIDQLKHAYQLPKTIKDGDYIVFGNMGAYSNACATQFNGIPEAEFVRVTSL